MSQGRIHFHTSPGLHGLSRAHQVLYEDTDVNVLLRVLLL